MAARKPRKAARRGFGAIRKLPSGRFQASYMGPDVLRHSAPHTFETRMDAEYWLAAERRIMDGGSWTPPKVRAEATRAAAGLRLREYGPTAVDKRRVRGEPLKPRTRALYLSLLDRVINPAIGDMPVRSIRPDDVARFYDSLDSTKPTQRAHAYALLRTVMNQAVEDQIISSNPCQVRGAGRSNRARRIEIATPDELVRIVENMPDRLRLLVLLAGWCALRYGELAELRRKDIDTARGTITVSRAVVRVNGEDLVGTPKSEAGDRVVAIPPHLLPVIEDHLERHTDKAADALLFPRPGTNRHLIHTEVTKVYTKARTAAGRPDLRLHDLRHTGATLAAMTGATIAELMGRLGHSTAAAAMRYQHAAEDRDRQIAEALSRMAEGKH